MITLKKLYTLNPGTRLRKIVRLLEEWERALLGEGLMKDAYPQNLMKKMTEDGEISLQTRKIALDGAEEWDRTDVIRSRRLLNSLRHALLSELGIPQADWDFIHPGDQADNSSGRTFEGIAVYLDEIRSPFNVGSIFRTAESMGVSEILLSPGTADPSHPRSVRSAMGCLARMSWKRLDYNELAERKEPVFALELGGPSVHGFPFPRKGLLILGSEEVGVSPACLQLADHSLGRASIPLYGWKGSLNVSVAYGIAMSLWARALSV